VLSRHAHATIARQLYSSSSSTCAADTPKTAAAATRCTGLFLKVLSNLTLHHEAH
jgi:hypothetical protein